MKIATISISRISILPVGAFRGIQFRISRCKSHTVTANNRRHSSQTLTIIALLLPRFTTCRSDATPIGQLHSPGDKATRLTRAKHNRFCLNQTTSEVAILVMRGSNTSKSQRMNWSCRNASTIKSFPFIPLPSVTCATSPTVPASTAVSAVSSQSVIVRRASIPFMAMTSATASKFFSASVLRVIERKRLQSISPAGKHARPRVASGHHVSPACR